MTHAAGSCETRRMSGIRAVRLPLVALLLLVSAPPSNGRAAPLGSSPGQSDQVVVVEADGGPIPPAPAGPPVMLVQPAPAVPPMNARPAAQHSLYVEGVTAIIANAISVNYSYRPIKMFALSVGFGAASIFFVGEAHGSGGQVQGHLLLGRMGDSSFELHAGVALMRATFSFLGGESSTPSFGVLPAFGLGYRYQPMDGGLLFRIGGAWSYGFGMGIQASIGATF